MSSKSKSKQEEALQFLDDLDSLSPNPPAPSEKPKGSGTASPSPQNERDAAEALAFLDEITQKSAEPRKSTSQHLEKPTSRAGTPTLRKSTERVRVGTPTPMLPSSSTGSIKGESKSTAEAETQKPAEGMPAAGAWGWGSVWSSASAAIQQARTVVDEQVKNLPKNEQAQKWSKGVIEYAKTAQLDKLGQDFKRVGLSTLTDILNAVAPPISEHEVIQVWLSHDMRGYDGLESLVYRALARIMEQVEGGDLIVNRGEESKPKEGSIDSSRDLNAVEGYEAAVKLAQANLNEIVKQNVKPPQTQTTAQNPTTYSYVYLRVQPYLTSITLPQQPASSSSAKDAPDSKSQSQLQFILLLSDPSHQLVHTTVTQGVPASWLELWDQYDWVEDLVAEAIRVGVEVIGQDYVVARMGWANKELAAAVKAIETEASAAAAESTAKAQEKEQATES